MQIDGISTLRTSPRMEVPLLLRNFKQRLMKNRLFFKGVMSVFSGLANSPETTKKYSNDVIEYVKTQIP